jgi:hypothetical protein
LELEIGPLPLHLAVERKEGAFEDLLDVSLSRHTSALSTRVLENNKRPLEAFCDDSPHHGANRVLGKHRDTAFIQQLLPRLPGNPNSALLVVKADVSFIGPTNVFPFSGIH